MCAHSTWAFWRYDPSFLHVPTCLRVGCVFLYHHTKKKFKCRQNTWNPGTVSCAIMLQMPPTPLSLGEKYQHEQVGNIYCFQTNGGEVVKGKAQRFPTCGYCCKVVVVWAGVFTLSSGWKPFRGSFVAFTQKYTMLWTKSFSCDLGRGNWLKTRWNCSQTLLREQQILSRVFVLRLSSKGVFFPSDVLDIAWSPHDGWLASSSIDNAIIIWNCEKFPGKQYFAQHSVVWFDTKKHQTVSTHVCVFSQNKWHICEDIRAWWKVLLGIRLESIWPVRWTVFTQSSSDSS